MKKLLKDRGVRIANPRQQGGHVVKGKHIAPMEGVFNMEEIEVKNY